VFFIDYYILHLSKCIWFMPNLYLSVFLMFHEPRRWTRCISRTKDLRYSRMFLFLSFYILQNCKQKVFLNKREEEIFSYEYRMLFSNAKDKKKMKETNVKTKLYIDICIYLYSIRAYMCEHLCKFSFAWIDEHTERKRLLFRYLTPFHSCLCIT